MSSYYGATYGVGLVLNEQEYTNFEQKYKEICEPIMDDNEKNQFTDLQNGDISYDDYMFIKSHFALQNTKENKPAPDNSYLYRFYVQHVCKDESDGMFFTPLNTWNSKICEGKSTRDHDSYVIWCSKPTGLHAFWNHKTYESKEELINEFKYKLAAYLPNDFDWESHIGNFDFCTYA